MSLAFSHIFDGARARSQRLTAPGAPLSSLRHRDFRMLLFSTMALQIGSWVQTIGQGWLVVHDLGGSATELAVVALLRGASLVVLSAVGGYLGERFERRGQLLGYTITSAVVAALLAFLVATGHVTMWLIYVTALVAGAAEALAGPIRTLLVFGSVAPEELTNAVALNSLGGNAMRVIGPAMGGVLIGFAGTQGTFIVQAVCLLIAAILTTLLRQSYPECTAKSGMFRSIGEGLTYVARDRRMLAIVSMAVIPSILVYPYVTFLPVFAKDVMHSDQTAYGFLAAAVGLGSLLGGVVVASTSGRERLGPGMMWACLCYTACVALFALVDHLWFGVAVLCVAGVFHSIYSAFNSSLMQMKADPAYRSRVISLQTMSWGLTPFTGVLMGKMIDQMGAQHVVFSWMVAAAISTLAIFVFSGEIRKL